jgi:hypothetical protein
MNTRLICFVGFLQRIFSCGGCGQNWWLGGRTGAGGVGVVIWRWQQRRWKLEKERNESRGPAAAVDVELAVRVATEVAEAVVRASMRVVTERRIVSEGDRGAGSPVMSGAVGSALTGLVTRPLDSGLRSVTIPVETMRQRKKRTE